MHGSSSPMLNASDGEICISAAMHKGDQYSDWLDYIFQSERNGQSLQAMHCNDESKKKCYILAPVAELCAN